MSVEDFVYEVEYQVRYPEKATRKGVMFGSKEYDIPLKGASWGSDGQIPPRQWRTVNFALIYNPDAPQPFHHNVRRPMNEVIRTGVRMSKNVFELNYGVKIEDLCQEHQQVET